MAAGWRLSLLVLCTALALASHCRGYLFTKENISTFYHLSESEQNEHIRKAFANRTVFLQNMLFLDDREEPCRHNSSYLEDPTSCPFSPSASGKVRPLVYIKTHKTGSSTVSGILWRELCLRRHANCFLPSPVNPGRTWDLTKRYDRLFSQHSLGTNLTRQPFDVWLSHVRPSDQLAQAMQTSHLVVSSVRHPAHRFQSAWHYYRLGRTHSLSPGRFMTAVLPQLVDFPDPGNIFPPLPAGIAGGGENNKNKNNNINNNRTALRAVWYARGTGLESTSQELLGRDIHSPLFAAGFYTTLLPALFSFRLFLVVCDRFDESMLLLRWLGHWKSPSVGDKNAFMDDPPRFSREFPPAPLGDEDLWYLAQKVRLSSETTPPSSPQTSRGPDFTEEDLARLAAAQPYDGLVYRVAQQALEVLVELYGSARFARDLAMYRANLAALTARCGRVAVRTVCHYVSPSQLARASLPEELRLAMMAWSEAHRADEDCTTFSVRLLPLPPSGIITNNTNNNIIKNIIINNTSGRGGEAHRRRLRGSSSGNNNNIIINNSINNNNSSGSGRRRHHVHALPPRIKPAAPAGSPPPVVQEEGEQSPEALLKAAGLPPLPQVQEADDYRVSSYLQAWRTLPRSLGTCWNLRLDHVQYVRLFWSHLLSRDVFQDAYFADREAALRPALSRMHGLAKMPPTADHAHLPHSPARPRGSHAAAAAAAAAGDEAGDEDPAGHAGSETSALVAE